MVVYIDMRTWLVILLCILGLNTGMNAQSSDLESLPNAPILKVIIRPTQPFFAPREPLNIEVACVIVAGVASEVWKERWSRACSTAEVKVEEARFGGYWGGVGRMAWLQNRLHLCLLPTGEAYEEEQQFRYTAPHWQLITIPPEKLSGLQGMIQVNAQVTLKHGGKDLDQEFSETVTAIVEAAENDSGALLSPEIQADVAAIQAGDGSKTSHLTDELLAHPNRGALELAARLFDHTERTEPLWTVIENSPFQQTAIDLALERLKDPEFVPDYDLLLKITGMKSRLDNPLEFEAEDRQPYTEYHPAIENASLAYFRSLLTSLIESTNDPKSARAAAIQEIASSLTETERCPLGTYGLSSNEATAINDKLSKK